MHNIKLESPKKITTDRGEVVGVDEINFTFEDLGNKVLVTIRIVPVTKMKSLILWEGDEYIKMGDYSQKQIQERILKLI